MKPKLLLFALLLLFAFKSFAQETIQVEDKLTPDVTIKYNVLSSDKKTMQGLYQAFYKKKTPVASGKYENGKRAGTWHFFDKAGKPVEHFNYTTMMLTYEAPDDTTGGAEFRYMIDANFTSSKDVFTKPIRIGGRYFGYLPYMNLFRLPREYTSADVDVFNRNKLTYMELLISPAGRLADYRVHVSTPYGERILQVNINKLSDEDRQFAPATLNGQEIASRIIIPCMIGGSGRLIF